MFWLVTNKQFRKESKKISNSFLNQNKLIDEATKERHDLKSQIDDNKLKIARLEGALQFILNSQQGNTQQSKSQSKIVSMNPVKSQAVPHNFETKLMNRVRRSKKSLTMAEISKLTPSHSTIEMFETIVLEKGLCSKASFYRYIASLKSQESHNLIETKTKLR